MSASHESSWLHRVWRDWRREIVRGGMLFALVVAGGLFVIGQVRAFEPVSLLRHGGVNVDFGSHGERTWSDAFRWAGVVNRGSTVWVRNLNGAITVERTGSDSVVVVAQRSSQHADPNTVEIVAVPDGGSVTICAMWPSSGGSACGPEGEYRLSGTKKTGDVAVRFMVSLPDGVTLDASTVNGQVAASGVVAPLALKTVNGSVVVDDVSGAVHATTVNGSITAALAAAAAVQGLELQTVNGSIRAVVPPGVNADVEASTVNGRVHTDLPIRVLGRINPRTVRGTIGSGGTKLHFRAVNGSVTLGSSLDAAIEAKVAEARALAGAAAVAAAEARVRAAESAAVEAPRPPDAPGRPPIP